MSLDSIRLALTEKKYPLDFEGHWISGEWQTDKRAQELKGSFNPSDGTRILHVNTSKSLVDSAIDAADQALDQLRLESLNKRFEYIAKFRQVISDYRDLIILALVQEVGKPLWDAEQDFSAAMKQFDEVLEKKESILDLLVSPYRVGSSDREYSLQSLGICMVFQTFSAPLNTVVQSVIAGLVAACPLVIMPSGHAALNGMILSHLLSLVGLPKGAVNVVFGNYSAFSKSLQDRRIKGVVYSGSREHCDSIRNDYGSTLGRELMLQSGGKNSVIISENVDIDSAIKTTLFGVLKSAGQLNTSTSRVFVPKSKLKQFNESMVKSVHALSIGPTDLANENPMMGPLYSQKAVDKFLRFQTMAKREAEETLVWGKAFETGSSGYFVSPGVHLFSSFDESSSYQSNVFMCPDLVVYAYDSIDEAIEWANSTRACLVTSVLGDKKSVAPLLSRIKSPNVMCNLPTVGFIDRPSLAGKELCGGRRFGGIGLISLMTYPHAIMTNDNSDFPTIGPWD